jgi:hypothetical protein
MDSWPISMDSSMIHGNRPDVAAATHRRTQARGWTHRRTQARDWKRAREQVAAVTCDEAAVEADIVRRLYGDPACRRLAHDTRRHVSS